MERNEPRIHQHLLVPCQRLPCDCQCLFCTEDKVFHEAANTLISQSLMDLPLADGKYDDIRAVTVTMARYAFYNAKTNAMLTTMWQGVIPQQI